MFSPRSFKVLTTLAIAAALPACGNGGTDPEPQTAVAMVSGNNQTGDVGQALPNPIVVRVTRDGAALAGANVSWSVTGGGGSVNPSSSSTDASGNAQTVWTLGPSAGNNAVQASVSGATGSPVVFGATGEDNSPPPMQAAVDVGDNFFSPASQRVAAGGTVTWTWTGSVGHNVTFNSGSNSATQSSGTFQRQFPTAGSFPYVCTIHSGMAGTIVVE